MAMLAEPRQRKRYNLVPRGKALYEDEHRFGTKMLEKMGWKKGQGLGANEDGSKDFVRIRYKNDALGLGFEERDDQWTQHEQSFNGLLKSLNNEGGSELKVENHAIDSADEIYPRVGFGFQETGVADKPKSMKEKISGVSLEERSKQSKARVHYKKFTKGKDLAQYSEKDLANIFGKKATDVQSDTNDFFLQLNDTYGKSQESREHLDHNDHAEETKISSNEVHLEANSGKKDTKIKHKHAEEKENEQEGSAKIIYSSLSMNDYFKKKIESIKRRKNGLIAETDIVNNTESCDELNENVSAKKKKKIKKEIKHPALDVVEQKSKIGDNNENMNIEQVMKKGKKKSKKRGMEELAERPLGDCSPNLVEKKSIKDKPIADQENSSKKHGIEETIVLSLEKIRKKSKKKNNIADQESSESIGIQGETLTVKKDKKSKKCDIEEATVLPLDDSLHDKAVNKSKKTKQIVDHKSSESNEIKNEVSLVKKENNSKKHNVEETEELFLDDVLLDKIEKKCKKNKNITNQENFEYNAIKDEIPVIKNKKNSKKYDIEETAKLLDNCLHDKVEKKSKKNKHIADHVNNAIKDVAVDLINEDNKPNKCDVVESAETLLSETKKEKSNNKTQTDLGKKRIFHNTPAETSTIMEIDLTQEPEKKKKKKNKAKETNDIIELYDSDIDVATNFENQVTNETKSSKEHTAIEESLSFTNPTENVTDFSSKKLPKVERKNLSSTAKNVYRTDVNFQVLDLEEIKKQYKAFNVYPISSFCAEKFRNTSLNNFTGSTLPTIEGYGIGPEIQLDIKPNKRDEERITNLWTCALSKYIQVDKPKKTYRHYIKEVVNARKKKQKIPKLNVKTLKRRNVFQVL